MPKSRSASYTLVALAALSQGVFAQAPPTGGQIQQIPAAPLPERAPPAIRFERGTPPPTPAADQVRIVVRSLRVTGQTRYSEPELVAIAGFTPGRELSLAEL